MTRISSSNMLTASLIVACVFPSSAHAVNKTWTGGIGAWSTSGGWTPSGIPTTNDNVLINNNQFVQMNVSSTAINELEMRTGANLATGGHTLFIQQPGGAGTIQLDGSSTQLIVNPNTNGSLYAVDTHQLNLSASTLRMSGGNVSVRNRLTNTSGDIIGHGRILFQGSTSPNLVNTNGTITADGGILTLQTVTSNGRLDLDGTGSETTSQLMAIDGSSTLQVYGLLADVYDGRLVIGAGNTIAFRQQAELSANSIIFFEGTGAPARIGGSFGTGRFISGAVMNVSLGVVEIDQAEVEFTPSSLISIAGGAELSLPSDTSHAGDMHLAGGELTGAGTFTNSGVITGRGTIATGNLVNDGTIWAQGGTITLDTQTDFPDIDGALNTGILRATGGAVIEVNYPASIVGFAGRIEAHGGRFAVPDNVDLRVYTGGSVNLSNSGHLKVGAYTQRLGSSLDVGGVVLSRIEAFTQIVLHGTNTINGPLELEGRVYIGESATFSGNGNVFLKADSRLGGDDGASFSNPVFIEGRLSPGNFQQSSTGIMSFDYVTLNNTATLEIAIGGTSPGSEHDKIIADTLHVGGTLDIRLTSDFVPSPGNSFIIASADFLSGTFTGLDEGALVGNFGGTDLFITYGSGATHKIILYTVTPGDLDGDGFVGIADMNLVLSNWNQTIPPGDPLADASGDGFVGIDDLNLVLANWNTGVLPAHSGTVPEPGTAGLLMISMLLERAHRRRPVCRFNQ